MYICPFKEWGLPYVISRIRVSWHLMKRSPEQRIEATIRFIQSEYYYKLANKIYLMLFPNVGNCTRNTTVMQHEKWFVFYYPLQHCDALLHPSLRYTSNNWNKHGSCIVGQECSRPCRCGWVEHDFDPVRRKFSFLAKGHGVWKNTTRESFAQELVLL